MARRHPQGPYVGQVANLVAQIRPIANRPSDGAVSLDYLSIKIRGTFDRATRNRVQRNRGPQVVHGMLSFPCLSKFDSDMTPPSENQKFYCYVDETGQDTMGELFIVSVVVSSSQRDELAAAPVH
jgi:hypothetical protein